MVSIVIPTYNEKENIVLLVRQIYEVLSSQKISYELIIVDDNSPDGTAVAIGKKFKQKNSIRLFVRKKKRGLATAILYGIGKARGNLIIGMDADLNHPPRLLPNLIGETERFDLIVASRFIKGGGMEEKPRYVFTYIFNLFLKHFLGFPTMDNMSGFYAMKKEKLLLLPVNKIYRGYGEYHLRLVYLAKKYGLKLKEIPVFYKKRNYGVSKTNLFKVFFNYLWVAINLRSGRI